MSIHHTNPARKIYNGKRGTPPNNNNRATRHFMVVVGAKNVDNKIEFRFYDPGRSLDNEELATSPDNILRFDRDSGKIQGTYNSQTYTLTEVVKTQ